VPGASGYLENAKKLGAVTGPLNNLPGLNGALGKLGMRPDTVAKFTPTVTQARRSAKPSSARSTTPAPHCPERIH